MGFYVAWKLVGLYPGIATGTGLAVLAFAWERRRGRSGLGAAIGLGIALVQAVVGFASGTAVGYLVPPVIANGLYGVVLVASAAAGRPLAAVFAAEAYPFSPAVKRSADFRRTFSTVSLVWGLVFLARCAARLAVLARYDVDVFIVVNIATSFPVNVGLMVWSLSFAFHHFRRTAGWDPT